MVPVHSWMVVLVQFMTDKSGLNTLGTAYSSASSQYVIVSSLSWKIVIKNRFKSNKNV